MTYEKVLQETLKHLKIDIENSSPSHIRFTCRTNGDIANIITINSILNFLGLIPYGINEISKDGSEIRDIKQYYVLKINDKNIIDFGSKL